MLGLEPHKYIKIVAYLQQREAHKKALLTGDNSTSTDKRTGNVGWRGPASVTTADTASTHGIGLHSALQKSPQSYHY